MLPLAICADVFFGKNEAGNESVIKVDCGLLPDESNFPAEITSDYTTVE